MAKKRIDREQEFEQNLKKYPCLLGTNNKPIFGEKVIVNYGRALAKYPDLEGLPPKLVAIAYSFREEQLREHRSQLQVQLANARSDVGVGNCGFESYPPIPSDIPALKFERECVVCRQEKKGIFICPRCWQLIRRSLELKAMPHHKKGWTGWGYEWPLDLTNLKALSKVQ